MRQPDGLCVEPVAERSAFRSLSTGGRGAILLQGELSFLNTNHSVGLISTTVQQHHSSVLLIFFLSTSSGPY